MSESWCHTDDGYISITCFNAHYTFVLFDVFVLLGLGKGLSC